MNDRKTFAVISDVHGNYKAFEAFLDYCKEHHINGIIGLGDYMTDSPYPEKMIELLKNTQKQFQCYMVRGNRENYLINNFQNDQGWKPSSSSGCLHYTATRLSRADISFLESMPEEMLINLEDLPAIYICHGIPGDIRGNVEESPEVVPNALQAIKENYLLSGHSHRQKLFTMNEKTYLNPGSLGFSLDGVGGNVQFALLHGDKNKWDGEFISIPYDANSFLNDFAASGLDELGFVLNRAVKKTVTTGINYVYACISETEHMTGLPPHLVPEDVWEEIARKLDL